MTHADLAPALLAVLAASLFATGVLFVRQGLPHLDSFRGTLISIGAAAGLYWVLSPWFVEAWYWTSPALLVFAVIGLFRPLGSANLANLGTHYLGPTISVTVAATSPLFGVAGGVLLLAEPLSTGVVVGTAAIVAGVIVLSWKGRAPRAWAAWALLLPLGAAFLRAAAHLLAKVGMDELPSPFMAGMVTYTVSFLLAAGLYGWRHSRGGERLSPTGVRWFLASGVANGLAILALNSALNVGHVVMVSPIVASAPLFTLLFSRLFRQETITGRMLLGVLLIVPGVMVVTLYR